MVSNSFITFAAQNMIAYIKGTITFKNPTYILVEAAGIGYHINISLNTYSRIEKEEQIKVLTYLHITENSQTLYGFSEAMERNLFVHLISVSGIGPNSARVILSGMTPEETRSAIISENVAAFQKIKGIGPKTAKRVILDLKDKLIKESGSEPTIINVQGNTTREEALSALVALGFNSSRVKKALNQVLQNHPDTGTVEKLIKLALKQLS